MNVYSIETAFTQVQYSSDLPPTPPSPPNVFRETRQVTMEPQKLSHSSKNSPEKAQFDLGAQLHGPQQLGNVDVFMHGRTLVLRDPPPTLSHRDGGREGWGEEEEKRRKG
ncbi:hypothetical protein N7453_000304, partial [Penicillium expansum]